MTMIAIRAGAEIVPSDWYSLCTALSKLESLYHYPQGVADHVLQEYGRLQASSLDHVP